MLFEKDHPSLPSILALFFITMLIVMFCYELTKQLLFPSISIWESHAITILFTSIISVMILFLPLRSLYREQERTKNSLHLLEEAEKRLRQSEAQYRSFVESAEDSIYTVDGDLRYLLINTRHLARRGLSPETYSGKSYRDFHSPVETAVFENQVRQVIATRKSVQGEYEQNGRYFLRKLNPVIDTADDSVIAVTVISTEITERKNAEEALMQANRKLNLLSGITRHDIRNQLVVLKGFLEISKKSLGDTAKMSGYILREEQAAKAIEHQIDFTREYQDLGVKSPAWQNVEETIKKTQAALQVQDIRILIEVGTIEVYADPMFEKVFYNLIDNALKYGGEDLTAIHIFYREIPDGLILFCEDDGAGIAEGDKARLFEKGFGKNTGLGLFLSREILGITGISITENGEPGKGARFEIRVPKAAYRFAPLPQ